MRYEEKLILNNHKINRYLQEEPRDKTNCLGEDETIVNTVRFTDGIEMDIKCCGVQCREGESNLPWTEAVLFDNGQEVACSEPSEEYFGKWALGYAGNEYVAIVVNEK